MLDIKLLRQNYKEIQTRLNTRGKNFDLKKIVDLDQEIRSIKTELQALQNTRNIKSKEIATCIKMKDMQSINDIKKVITGIKTTIGEQELTLKKLQHEFQTQMEMLPNIPDASVPIGDSDQYNVVIKTVGNKPNIAYPKPHWELLNSYINNQQAVSMAGSRFTMLYGPLAKLYRILGTFMLEEHIKNGFVEYTVPLILNYQAFYHAGQLPVLMDDMYKIVSSTGDHKDSADSYKDESYLIPTSESALINCIADKTFLELEHPMRYVALSPCFRKEAGAAGKDNRGLIRLHQFYKVEMVSISNQNQSEKELEFLTSRAESILKKLHIPYQVTSICTGDLGFHSGKTYDIEAWMPAQNTYRELSSCSNCYDFQSRRMFSQYKQEEKKYFVHTLNGSGLAVDRTLAVIIENYQLDDGRIKIPDILQKSFGSEYLV